MLDFGDGLSWLVERAFFHSSDHFVCDLIKVRCAGGVRESIDDLLRSCDKLHSVGKSISLNTLVEYTQSRISAGIKL